MATDIANATRALVARGWPRDYADVHAPCWYILSHGPLEETLEDPNYAPDISWSNAQLVIARDRYLLYTNVAPSGELGETTIEVHDGQGPMGDGTAGVIAKWTGLDHVLDQAQELYLQWELQQMRGAQTNG